MVRLSYFCWSAYFLQQPEAQHSGESQHDAVAAFTAPAKPSAITATNKIALILFIEILLLELKGLLLADGMAINAETGPHFR